MRLKGAAALALVRVVVVTWLCSIIIIVMWPGYTCTSFSFQEELHITDSRVLRFYKCQY